MSAGSGDRAVQRDRVERALADLVRDRGPGSVREPGTLRALLADYVGDQAIRCRPEIDLLVATAQAWASGQRLQGADADWAQHTLSTPLGPPPPTSPSPPPPPTSPPTPVSPPAPPRRRGRVALAALAAFLGLGGLLIANLSDSGSNSVSFPETPTRFETLEPSEVETLEPTEVETLDAASESSAVRQLRAQLPSFEFSECEPFDPAESALNGPLADLRLTPAQLPQPLAALQCDRPDDRFTHLFWLVPGTDLGQLLADAAAAVGADLGGVENTETGQQTGWYFEYDSQIDESASLGYYLFYRPDVIAVVLVDPGTTADFANITLY